MMRADRSPAVMVDHGLNGLPRPDGAGFDHALMNKQITQPLLRVLDPNDQTIRDH